MKEQITIKYNSKPDDELDSKIAGLLLFPPFKFKWIGQGYDVKKNVRDIRFEREK